MIQKKYRNKKTLRNSTSEVLNDEDNTIKTKKNQFVNHYIHKIHKKKQDGGAVIRDAKLEYFNIKSKNDYFKLKRDITATRITFFFANKFGRISDTDYKLHLSFIWANFYFAKLRYYNSEMLKISNILISQENAIIPSIRTKINEILDIQNIIKTGLFKGSKGSKESDKELEKLVKRQDSHRVSLMKYFLFNNNKNISPKCDDSFLCLIGKYRKFEAKFNKHFLNFKIQLAKFFSVFPNCDDNISRIKLHSLDIMKSHSEVDHDVVFNQSKCNTDKLNKIFAKSFEEAIDINDELLGSDFKDTTLGEKTHIDDKYLEFSGNLSNVINAFNISLDNMKQRFITLEYYGIRRYPGILPRKTFFEKLGNIFQNKRNTFTDFEVKNPRELEQLSKDPKFIQEFSDTLADISIKTQSFFTPLENNFKSIIPNIIVDQTKLKLDDVPILTFNLSKFDYTKYKISDLFKNPTSGHVNGSILCFQNGTHEMINPESNFVKDFLNNNYIATSFSRHGPSDPTQSKYNIIFVARDCFLVGKNDLDSLPYDQSSQFVLNDLPENMSLENNQKSYTVTNLIFNSTSNKGISIVCTELVGSSPDDLYYMKEINDFEYKDSAGQTIKGLRSSQLYTIINTIDMFNNPSNPVVAPGAKLNLDRLSSFIVGDLGYVNEKKLTDKIYKNQAIPTQPGAPLLKPRPCLDPSDKSTILKITHIDHLLDYYKNNFPEQAKNNDANLIDKLTKFYVNGNNILCDSETDIYGCIGNYKHETYNDTNCKGSITNEILKLPTAGIAFFKKIKLPIMITVESDQITALGGELPLGYIFNVNDGLQSLSSEVKTQVSSHGTITGGTDLFTEQELRNVLVMIDTLMGHFSYGTEPYLRRELGCLSLDNNTPFSNRTIPELYSKSLFGYGSGKSAWKKSIHTIFYKNLEQIATFDENQEGLTQLKDFYVQPFPNVIETYLYQLTGSFYKSSNPNTKAYYNENQITSINDRVGEFHTHKMFENESSADTLIRLLLMPSSHVKLIMDIDIRKNITPSEYKHITKKAINTYYRDYVLPKLESILSVLLNKQVNNNNIIKYLLERDADNSLKNIKDGKNILNLFQIILTFLRIKYVKHQIQTFETNVKAIEKPKIEIEKIAKQADLYKGITAATSSTMHDIIYNTDNPLNTLFYSHVITNRTDFITPEISDNSENIKAKIKGIDVTKIKPIAYKSFDDLKGQGLMSIEYYEKIINYLITIRNNAIIKLLNDFKLDSHHDKEYMDIFTKYENKSLIDLDLSGNLDKIYRDITVHDIKNANAAKIIYDRCIKSLERLKQLNEYYSTYFLHVANILKRYYNSLEILILYERFNEDIIQYTNVKDIIKTLKDAANSSFNNINTKANKFTQNIELVIRNIENIYNRIDTKLDSDLEISMLPILNVDDSNKITLSGLVANNTSSIQISARICFGIITKIYNNFNNVNTKPNPPVINYSAIQNLCNNIELSFHETRDIYKTLGLKVSSIDKSYFKYHEFITNVSQLVWTSSYILNNIEEIKNNLPTTKINITSLLNKILQSFNDLIQLISNDSIEISNYVIQPLSLIVNLLYYIANYVCYDKTTANAYEQPIFKDDNKHHGPLKGLHIYFNRLIASFSQSNIIDAIYKIRVNNNQISNAISEKITNKNPIFGDIYKLINSVNNYNTQFGINLDTKSPINARLLEFYNILKNIMDLTEDKIHSEIANNDISYYIYTYQSLAHMVSIDRDIAFTIRNFQTNDKCNNKDNSTKLEYELKYKPNILGMSMGKYIPNPALEGEYIYVPNNEHCNTRMLYCFLDVLDTYTKDATKYQTKLAEIKGYCDAAFDGHAADTYPAFFNKMLYDATLDVRIFHNTVNKELYKLFVMEKHRSYLLYGNTRSNTPFIFAIPEPAGAARPKIQSVTHKFNNNNIFDNNLLAIMKRLTGLHRSNGYRYTTPNMRQYNTPENTFKAENVFNIDYFISGRVYAQENLKIDIEIIRKFFLEVIYQNAFIEPDKDKRIDLIINIIFALSYILNHTVGGGVARNNTEIINFAFIILGLGVFNNYGLAKYNQIKDLIDDGANGIKTTGFLNKYLEKFYSFALSYTYKEQEPIYKIYNDMTISYVKNLSMFNANKLAYEIITDETPNGNTYKVLEFINNNNRNFTDTKHDEILKDIITFMFYYKKIQALTGVIYAWINRNKTEDENSSIFHQYAFLDYLKEIEYHDIVNNKLDTIINKYNKLLDLGDYDKLDQFKNIEYQFLEYNKIDIIPQAGNHYNSETTSFNYDEMTTYITKYISIYYNILTSLKDDLLKGFFEHIFGDNETFDPDPNFDNDKNPLYYKNQLMRYLEDTLECILSNYNIDYADLEYDKIDNVVNAFKKHLQIPIEIFKLELNNTLLPYFNISDPDNTFIKLIRDKLANIYDMGNDESYVKKHPDLIPKYIWDTNYDSDKINASQLVDKQIFTLINKLINAKDKNNNYYLNSGNHDKLISKIGNIDAADGVYTKFSNEILKGSYLFNDHEFNLNVKQIKDNLHSLQSDIPGFNMNYQLGLQQYFYISKNIKGNYTFLCIFNSIKKLIDDLVGKTIYNNTANNANIQNVAGGATADSNLHITSTTNSVIYYNAIKTSMKNILNKDINFKYNYYVTEVMTNALYIHWAFSASTDNRNWTISATSPIKLFDVDDYLQIKMQDFIVNIIKAFNELLKIYPQLPGNRSTYGNNYRQIQASIQKFNTAVNTEIDKLNDLKMQYKYDINHINGYDINANCTQLIFYENTNALQIALPGNIYEFKNQNVGHLENFQLEPIMNNDDKKRYIHEYFRNIYDFIDGLSEDVKHASRIVPTNFDNQYIKQNISHRNNLFLAVANIGFLNNKSIDFLSKHNVYYDIKINMLNNLYTINNDIIYDPHQYKIIFGAYNNVQKYIAKRNIFIDELNRYEDLEAILQEYINPKSLTDIIFDKQEGKIFPDSSKSERCLYWTHPLFNINYGTLIQVSIPPSPLADNYNLDNQRSPFSYKNFIARFIVSQFARITDTTSPLKLNMLGSLCRIEKYYLIDANDPKSLPIVYKNHYITKNIKNPKILENIYDNIKYNYNTLKGLIKNINEDKIIALPIVAGTPVDNNYIKILSNQLNSYVNFGPLRLIIYNCLFEIFNTYLIYESISTTPSLTFSKFNKIMNDFTNNNDNLFKFIYIIFTLINNGTNVKNSNNNKLLSIFYTKHADANIIYYSNYSKLEDPSKYNLTGATTIFDELSFINPINYNTSLEAYATKLEAYNNNHLIFLDYNNMIIYDFDYLNKEIYKISKTKGAGLADYKQIMINIIKQSSNPSNILNLMQQFGNRLKNLFNLPPTIPIVEGGFRHNKSKKRQLRKTKKNSSIRHKLKSMKKQQDSSRKTKEKKMKMKMKISRNKYRY